MSNDRQLEAIQSWLIAHPGVVLELRGHEVLLRWARPNGDTVMLPALVPSGGLAWSVRKLLEDYDLWEQRRGGNG